MKKKKNLFLNIYHKVLNLFFDFDLQIYALTTPKIRIRRVFSYEFNKKISTNKLNQQEFNCNTIMLKPPLIIFYKAPELKDKLKINDYTQNLNEHLKIIEEKLKFITISRKYKVLLQKIPQIYCNNLEINCKIQKATQKDIHISQSVKTIQELLELEPYLSKYPIKKIAEIPVTKYSVKKEKFTKEQIDLMQTRLAQQGKCKKYSINIENIYDKLPDGLYDELKLEKDKSLNCKYSKKPEVGNLQLLIIGKRKYDTQITKAYIKYSELGI